MEIKEQEEKAGEDNIQVCQARSLGEELPPMLE
jgi:hypothetical protein